MRTIRAARTTILVTAIGFAVLLSQAFTAIDNSPIHGIVE